MTGSIDTILTPSPPHWAFRLDGTHSCL